MGVSSRRKGDKFVFILTALRNKQRENQEPEPLLSKRKGKRRTRERKQHRPERKNI